MAVVYFDSSALVKLCVLESGSDLAETLWRHADLVVSSRLSLLEVPAVLAAGLRGGALSPSESEAAQERWAVVVRGVYVLELTEDLTRRSQNLIGRHGLRAADAVHVAGLGLLAPAAPVLATWDDNVRRAAQEQGLRVLPGLVDAE